MQHAKPLASKLTARKQILSSVYVSLGSNIDRKNHINLGLNALEARFGELITSPVYSSPAIGFEGPDFYNVVVNFKTHLSSYELNRCLLKIESHYRLGTDKASFRSRTLDIDLLLYDDLIILNDELELPRRDILQYPFVLRALADIAGNELHPQLQFSYKELWAKFKSTAVLRQVSLCDKICD